MGVIRVCGYKAPPRNSRAAMLRAVEKSMGSRGGKKKLQLYPTRLFSASVSEEKDADPHNTC